MDGDGQNLSPEQVKGSVARTLIAALTDECKSYCMLSGYEQLPESFDTDIDFMVTREEFRRMARIIEHVARQTSTRLFHTVEHEITARSYSLGFQSGSQLTIVQPDSACDYRHFGSLWLRADEVLAARRWHSRGFWIPAAAHEFAYYLIKRLNKRYLSQEHGEKLHRLYEEDRSGCENIIARFWRGQNKARLIRMAASNDWTSMNSDLRSFRRELRRNSANSMLDKVIFSPTQLTHFWTRMSQPTGGWVAFIGPDGSGKSAVISAIRQQFTFAYREVRCFHLRPKSLRKTPSVGAAVTDPHGQRPRGLLMSLAKVLFLLADYFVGFLAQVAPAIRRSQLLIFDRYIYDLLIDCKRIRYGGPLWLLRFVARIVPRPDLVILLDAPAEVLWSRKQEVPFEEVVRQREAYLQVARGMSSTIIVNAARPLADVIHDVDCAIVEYFARRTAQRLKLQAPSFPADPLEIEVPSQRC
jgi:thymidylate kinase